MKLVFDGDKFAKHYLQVTKSKDVLDANLSSWKSYFLKNLLKFIDKFQPTSTVLTLSSKPSWRKTICSDYKTTPTKLSKKSDFIDYRRYHQVSEDFFKELKKSFNIGYLEVPTAESTDLSYLISEVSPEKTIIVSTSINIEQIVSSKVSVFNIVKNDFVRPLNAKKELLVRILDGISSHNIHCVYAPRKNTKTLQKHLSEGLASLVSDEELSKRLQKNKILLDFNHIPMYIKKNVSEDLLKNLGDINSSVTIDFLSKYILDWNSKEATYRRILESYDKRRMGTR